MFHVVLVEPEIPPNTGNVIRLCANTGAQLHLIEPLGFKLDHAQMRRAGLDYREFAEMQVHANWTAFLQKCQPNLARIFLVETDGALSLANAQFLPGDVLVFGCETRGLPAAVRASVPSKQQVRLPMRPNNRSLNLSNAVAIAVFEAWRQNGFEGGL